MHTEYIASHNAPHRCQGPVTSSLRHAEWFHDSGITPEGRWWIAPTALFIEQIWQSCAGDDLKKRGFVLNHDGHTVGATQNTVIYLPTTLIGKEFA